MDKSAFFDLKAPVSNPTPSPAPSMGEDMETVCTPKIYYMLNNIQLENKAQSCLEERFGSILKFFQELIRSMSL